MQIAVNASPKDTENLDQKYVWGHWCSRSSQRVDLTCRHVYRRVCWRGPSSVLWGRVKGKAETNRAVGRFIQLLLHLRFPQNTTRGGGGGEEGDPESLNTGSITAEAWGNCSPEHVKTPPYLFYSWCLLHACSKFSLVPSETLRSSLEFQIKPIIAMITKKRSCKS